MAHTSKAPLEALLSDLPSRSRRTFFAVLVLAIQFTLDKCYSNCAWAKISSLQWLGVGHCTSVEGARQRY